MNVRKYFATDMRSALEMVRVQQGPDVLILSNRKVDNGVELITADGGVDEAVLASFKAEQAKQQSGVAVDEIDLVDIKSEPKPTLRHVTSGATNVGRAEASGEIKSTTKKTTPRDLKSARIGQGQFNNNDSQENLLWTDEGTVRKMHLEMQNIKGLLEQQLSGLAWADYGNKYPNRARLLRTLSTLGVAPALARKLVEQVPATLDMQSAWRHTLAVFAKNLKVLPDPILARGGCVAICGPTGVGKTTLVSKLAARYGMRNGVENVTIVSLDEHRLGAHQQLKVFARLSGIECIALSPKENLDERLRKEGSGRAEAKHLTLIDTGGFAPEDIRFRESAAMLSGVETYLAVAATTEYSSLRRALSVCEEMQITGCLLTKLDEAVLLGGALSALISARIPLAYVSAGQAVPDDLENADAKQLVAQAVAMGSACRNKADNYTIEHAFA